jgi:isoleucyl-tRNA synthetase
LKVRQPLSKVLVYAGKAELRSELVDIVVDELNVKAFEFVASEGSLVSYKLMPDNKLLGPKYGQRFPQVRAALMALDPTRVADSVRAGVPVMLEVTGETLELLPEEVLVSTEPAPGLAVAADKLITVGIDSALTPELKAEGLAREVVRRIQDMRKKANFNIEDRISTWYQASEEMAQVFTTWKDYIKAETLTTQFVAGAPPEGAYMEEQKIEAETVVIGIRQN